MRKDTWSQMLTCDLSEPERDEAARAATKTVRQLTLHDENMKVKKAEMDAQRKELEKEIRRLSIAADTGKEERLVECYETPNLATLRIESIRMDTGEAFLSREMDADERKRARQREFDYSPEIVKAAEAERKAQDARKKVTEMKDWSRRREVDKMDADRERGIGIERAKPPEERAPEGRPEPGPFARDPSAKRGSMENPLPLPEPIRDDGTEPERPGSEPRDDLYATAEIPAADDDDPPMGTADNPTPLDPPPPDERH